MSFNDFTPAPAAPADLNPVLLFALLALALGVGLWPLLVLAARWIAGLFRPHEED